MYFKAGQSTDDNMVHAHCMLGTKGYKHILGISNTAFPPQLWLYERACMLRPTYCMISSTEKLN
jgi:hypothetical protein